MPVLKYYDVTKTLTLSVDARSEGLGAVVLQDGQPIAYGSRSLTDCQKRYAKIGKRATGDSVLLREASSIPVFHQYQIQVESDHKPLACDSKT